MIREYTLELLRPRKWLFARFVLGTFGRSASQMALIFFIQQFLSSMIGKPTKLGAFLGGAPGSTQTTWMLAGCLLVAYAVGTWLSYDSRVAQQRSAEAVEVALITKLVNRLMVLGVGFIQKQRPGDMIQALREDVANYRSLLHSASNLFLEVVLIVGMCCVLFTISPMLAFWTIVVLPLGGIPAILITNRRMRMVARRVRTRGTDVFDGVLQILAGIRTIKVYGMEDREAKAMVQRTRAYFALFFDVIRLGSLARVISEGLGGLCLIVTVVVGGFQVIGGKLSWTSLLAFLMASRAMFGPLYNLYGFFAEIPTYVPSAQRIGEILASKPNVSDRPGAHALPDAPLRITFENVSFGYDSHTTVLEGISFQVTAGETIGIVGPSGSGKSTLLNLLLRFYDPAAGRILFDGRDVREFRIRDVCAKIAVVTQDPFVFAVSVRENIRCGRPGATDEEVEEAARAANIHDEIMALPRGYDTPIGIGGRELSRGQAQRVNIARALLRGAPLLMLDEATSSLDSVAEAQVQNSIDRLMQQRTSFVVAHRLSTLRNATRLIVLEAGRCVGTGTHGELLRTCPVYCSLWEMQRLGEHPDEAAAAADASKVAAY